MNFILTLVASDNGADLNAGHVKEAGKIIYHYNIDISGKINWLDKGKALDVLISGETQSALSAHLRDYFSKDKVDFFITPAKNRQKKLLLADMDSTIASSETLDELADFAGIKDKIAEITALAMEGKLDFHDALRERVGLLKDLPIKALEQTLEKTKLNPGAEILASTMRAHGATCVLVSGGFTFFTSAIARVCDFEFHHGNTLDIENGKLTGFVKDPILDKFSKLNFLNNYVQDLGIDLEDCLTIGDGANDIPMLKAAGLGIGYHPKQAVLNEVHNAIIHGDLTAALYAQGYSEDNFKNNFKKNNANNHG